MVNYREKITKIATIALFSLFFTSFALFPMNPTRAGRRVGAVAKNSINLFSMRFLYQNNVRPQGCLGESSYLTYNLNVPSHSYKALNRTTINKSFPVSIIYVGTATQDLRMRCFLGSSLLSGIIAGFASNALQDDVLVIDEHSVLNDENNAQNDVTVTAQEIIAQNEERRAKAQEIKEIIDALLLDCFGRDYWSDENKKIKFAQTVDLCLEKIKGFENLVDEFEDIFFLNKPESWPQVSAQTVIKSLLEVRDENSIKNISNKLYDLFYLLPQELQNDWKKLGIRLYYRLKTGHPGTQPTYNYEADAFDKKEQAELR